VDVPGAGRGRSQTHELATFLPSHPSWVTPGPTGQMPAGSTVRDCQPRRHNVDGVDHPLSAFSPTGTFREMGVAQYERRDTRSCPLDGRDVAGRDDCIEP